MSMIILHDLEGEEVAVNVANLNAAKRRYPDETSVMTEPFTKLFYTIKDKGMEALGFPDSVKESPSEIVALAAKMK